FALRGHRFDLLCLRRVLPAARRRAGRLPAPPRFRADRRVARGLGAGRGERDPGHSRSPRAGVRCPRLRRDHRRRRDAQGAAVTGEGRTPGPRRRVSPLALLRVLWRSLFLQAAWNPHGMQNLGFAFAMEPALGELYPDASARARAAERHLEFFNCHPYLAAAIVGGAVRLEEEVARGAAEPRSVSAFKSALASPFAALGDGFFW